MERLIAAAWKQAAAIFVSRLKGKSPSRSTRCRALPREFWHILLLHQLEAI
jgi:hypothetical protein